MEFAKLYRRQAARFQNLARENSDPKIRAKLQTISNEYQEKMNGMASDGAKKPFDDLT